MVAEHIFLRLNSELDKTTVAILKKNKYSTLLLIFLFVFQNGLTALHYAAAMSRKDGLQLYKMLLQAGADPKIRDTVSNFISFLFSLKRKLKQLCPKLYKI